MLSKSNDEHVIAGDANESLAVWVSRYFKDVDAPAALSALSSEIEAIVMSPKMCRFYQRFTGTEKLSLRRCQANRLQKGDYIGEHKDQDSSPDYFATIVFHFGGNNVGGYFQTSESAGEFQRYKPRARMVLVNNCSISRQVTVVEEGERLTLACFLSSSFRSNKNTPEVFRLDPNRVLAAQ